MSGRQVVNAGSRRVSSRSAAGRPGAAMVVRTMWARDPSLTGTSPGRRRAAWWFARSPAGSAVIGAAAGGPFDHRWILSTHVRAWRGVRLPTPPLTINALGRDEMSAIGPRCTPRPGAWTV